MRHSGKCFVYKEGWGGGDGTPYGVAPTDPGDNPAKTNTFSQAVRTSRLSGGEMRCN